MILDEIVPGDRSGGATVSHTIEVPALQRLLGSLPRDARLDEYRRAVLQENILAKATLGARHRTFGYLRQLYRLEPESLLFRALRDLWDDDPAGQPLLAGLCALARDPALRATGSVVLATEPGVGVVSSDLASAAEKAFPGSYNEATLAKIGRNTFSSWAQTGHLRAVARTTKVRSRAICTPAAAAFALLLGHLQGIAGAAMFDTCWAKALDRPLAQLLEFAVAASRRGLIDFRHSGGVTQVGFSELLRRTRGDRQ